MLENMPREQFLAWKQEHMNKHLKESAWTKSRNIRIWQKCEVWTDRKKPVIQYLLAKVQHRNEAELWKAGNSNKIQFLDNLEQHKWKLPKNLKGLSFQTYAPFKMYPKHFQFFWLGFWRNTKWMQSKRCTEENIPKKTHKIFYRNSSCKTGYISQ